MISGLWSKAYWRAPFRAGEEWWKLQVKEDAVSFALELVDLVQRGQ